MLKSDIVKYLVNQDEVRQKIKDNTNAVLKSVNVDKLMNNPKAVISAITEKILEKNKPLFQKSEKIGLELKEKL